MRAGSGRTYKKTGVEKMTKKEFARMITQGRLMLKLSFYPKIDLDGWK